MTTTSQDWHLIERPTGMPGPHNFALVAHEIAAPQQGEIVVKNEYLSVDPYMRGRMRDAKSYAQPYALGEVMHGGAVGVVVEVAGEQRDSSGALIREGDRVLHSAGWRTHATVSASAARVLPEVAGVEPRQFLGALGMPGLTAYVGLFTIARLQPADRVFVSGAAGAVGSLAGQMARLYGAGLVIGSAGGPEKAAWLTQELGFHVAIDYRAGNLVEALLSAAPEGIDVYFDNVGGDHLEAALAAARIGARFAKCGSISHYNVEGAPAGPRNMSQIVHQRLGIQGFLVSDHADVRPEFEKQMMDWLSSGQMVVSETIVDGIENAVDAFISMFHGKNFGKMLVRI